MVCCRFAIGVLVIAASAQAQSVSCPARATAGARALLDKLDYLGAAQATRDAERCADGSPAELAETLRVRGQAYAEAGEYPAAIKAFAAAAALAPDDAADPALPEKIRKLQQVGIESARKSGAPRSARLTPIETQAPALEVQRPSQAPLVIAASGAAVASAIAIGLAVALVLSQPPELGGSLGRLELPSRSGPGQ